jgi:hypothetical protein
MAYWLDWIWPVSGPRFASNVAIALRERHVQFIGQSLAVAGLRDLKTPTCGFHIPADGGKLGLIPPQLDIRAGDIGDDRNENRVTGLRRGQRVQPRGLDLAAQLAEHVKLPRRIEASRFVHVIEAGRVAGAMQRLRDASAGIVATGADPGARRQLAFRKSSARRDELPGTCLLQAAQRDCDIGIGRDRPLDK